MIRIGEFIITETDDGIYVQEEGGEGMGMNYGATLDEFLVVFRKFFKEHM